MPLIGGLLRVVDLTKLAYVIPAVSGNPSDAVVVAYGKFLQVSLDFVIISFTVFVVVSVMNKALKKAPKEKKDSEDVVLLREIRDVLVAKDGSASNSKKKKPVSTKKSVKK